MSSTKNQGEDEIDMILNGLFRNRTIKCNKFGTIAKKLKQKYLQEIMILYMYKK